jgi:hypothetical protein
MPEIPEHAPKPKDRLPKQPTREAEADDGHVNVEQNGVEFRVPIGGKLPLRAARAFRDGDELLGVELMLGAEQWAAFDATDPTVDDLGELIEQLNEATGN